MTEQKRDGAGDIIDFGKPVHWLAMTKQEAQEFALNILRRSADGYVKLKIPD